MITNADVKKLESTFATKEELEKLDARTADGFSNVQTQLNRIDNTISEIKVDLSEVKEEISEIKNHMITMEDHIMGALDRLTVENEVTATYRPKIENHERRITKVESAVFAN
jgi:chromosome segregation ATPase